MADGTCKKVRHPPNSHSAGDPDEAGRTSAGIKVVAHSASGYAQRTTYTADSATAQIIGGAAALATSEPPAVPRSTGHTSSVDHEPNPHGARRLPALRRKAAPFSCTTARGD
jgi:hypothetical protein